jgi:hypothetical protein
MPIFRRKPKETPPPSAPLPPDEKVERSTRASLLYGSETKKGNLYLTTRRIMFEAEKGDARWMVVPHDQMKAVGLYPSRAGMGGSGARGQCLVVETDKNEQVWWDFDDREEREWLPLLQPRVKAPPPPPSPAPAEAASERGDDAEPAAPEPAEEKKPDADPWLRRM